MSALAMAAPSVAQVDQALPSRDELIRPAGPPPPAASRLQVDSEMERAPCPLADAQFTDIRVTVDDVRLEGLTHLSQDDLRFAYEGYLNSDQPVSVLCEMRDAVATELRRRGYLAAVHIPAQEIDDGSVQLNVLFARLVDIRVRGDAGRSERQVAAYLQALTRDPVFNQLTAERYLLLARDLPGLDVRLTLKPTGQPGEVYGEVTIVRTPFEADLNIHNLGAENTGRFGVQARARLNGLTGLGDQTTLALFSTTDLDEQQVLQAAHQFRIGDHGLDLAARVTQAWTQPDLGASADLLEADTLFVNLEARYPLRRSQAANLWLSGGLDAVDQTVEFDQFPIAEDKLRVAYARIEGDLFDARPYAAPRWRLGYGAEIRQGLDILDASPEPGTAGFGDTPASRADGEPTATVLRADAVGELVLGRGLTLAGTALAQYAFDPLLSFEEFSLGNYSIGRGYDPGVLLGDDGAGVSAELRWDRAGRIRGWLAIQPFVFVDAARVWNKDADGESLVSVGAGVRASVANRFRLDLMLAVPTDAVGLQTEREDPRLLVSFTTLLWPWSAN